MLHRRLTLASAALLACFLLVPEGASALPRKKDRWIEVRTPNFTLYSNSSATTTRSIGNDLERFRGLLAQLTTAELNAPIPTLVYVFDGDRAFMPYLPLDGGKPARFSGLFQPADHGNYIAINGALRDDASAIVYTMYAYYFLHNNLPGLPLWFQKGLAEYYGTLEMDKKHADVGKPDGRHLRRLRGEPMLPLAELFAAEESPSYRRGPRALVFDAQCWAIVHYLLIGNEERRQQAFDYINLILNGTRRDAAFEKAFNTTHKGLQREVESYIRKFAFGYLRFDLPEVGAREAEVRPLARPDVLYRLGDLLISQYDFRPAAGEHFRAALEAQPDHARGARRARLFRAAPGPLGQGARALRPSVGSRSRRLHDPVPPWRCPARAGRWSERGAGRRTPAA